MKISEDLVSNLVDFDDICDMHYNKNVTDKQITTLLTNAFSFAIDDIEKV